MVGTGMGMAMGMRKLTCTCTRGTLTCVPARYTCTHVNHYILMSQISFCLRFVV